MYRLRYLNIDKITYRNTIDRNLYYLLQIEPLRMVFPYSGSKCGKFLIFSSSVLSGKIDYTYYYFYTNPQQVIFFIQPLYF